MAYGTSMQMLWQIMERHRGSQCEYADALVVPDRRVVFLPHVRATFLREWPGSPNIHTRKATYQRVFKSIARAGSFTRLSVVPLMSFRVDDDSTAAIFTSHGRDLLFVKEELSPFVELKATPVVESVPPKTEADVSPPQGLMDAISILSSPVKCWGEDSSPVSVIRKDGPIQRQV